MAPRKSKQPASKARTQDEVVQGSASSTAVDSTNAATAVSPSSPGVGKRIASALLSPNASKALCLVILASIYSPLSQHTLAPVYGAIPSATYHKYGLIGSSLLSFALRGILPQWVKKSLPSFAFWIPTIQFILFKFSSTLGNPVGPLVTEAVTCFPLITLSCYMAGKIFEEVDLSFMNSEAMAEAAPSMLFYMLFTIIERVFRGVLANFMTLGVLTSRVGLQMIIGVLYGLILPTSIFWPAVPSIALTLSMNVHNPLQRTTTVLNNTLALHQYTLLERKESVTGYLSVLEDNQKKFRVLRCDHSLLGGQWLDTPENADRKVAEPIYAVFTMLEAVRLVEGPKTQKRTTDAPERALFIGAGIGTAPSAFKAHGISTTIIELDPAIYYFAIKYFGLQTSPGFIVGDAVGYVNTKSKNPTDDILYDYIIHDSFTGGAVPSSLFTFEFLTSLSRLLKVDGMIAINYAGDLNLFSATMVYRTILAVFPKCRVFREEPERATAGAQDFTNLVYFCRHPRNTEPITFRKPVTADYLGSGARKQSLLPKYELNVHEKFGTRGIVIRNTGRSIKELDKWQARSAIGHWQLMRTVMPDAVWENW